MAIARERDPAARARLLESCWADAGRLVVHGGRTLQGRAQMQAMFDRFAADTSIADVRVLEKDARGTTFQLRYVTERKDGTRTEALDVGEVDAEGRIALLIVFPSPGDGSPRISR